MVILPRILHGSTGLLDLNRRTTGMETADFVTGIILTALVPAAVWCGLLKAADTVFQFGLTWQTFTVVGLSIATFLAGIYSCLVRNV